MLPPMSEDPRLDELIALFDEGAFEEASDVAEELFFEAVGAERPVARVLLQLCVGMVHVEHGQRSPALERLDVGLVEARGVRNWMGIDGEPLVSDLEHLVASLSRGIPPGKVRLRKLAP
jgi:hypothetical protein